MPPKRKRNATMISPSRGRGFRKPPPAQRQKKPRQNDLVNIMEETRDEGQPSFSQEPQEIRPTFGLPEDLGNFENSDFSLESNMSDFIPVPEVSCFDNVGQCIPLKLKQKIWGGQFIDLSLLLKSAKDIHDSLGGQGEIKIQDGKVCIVKSNSGSYLTIEKWTNAFMIYTSVMLEKYRSRAQEFLKYMRDIRLAASRSQGWFKYDEQYRLRKANNPESSWGIINQEFWLLYIAGQGACESQTSSNNAKPFSGKGVVSAVTQYCYLFNQGKKCNFFPRCRYRHNCRRCGGKHPEVNCSNN